MSLVAQIESEKKRELEKVSLKFAFVGFGRSSAFIEDFLNSTKLQDERITTARRIEELEEEIRQVAANGGDTESLSEMLASVRNILAQQTKEYAQRLQGIQQGIAQGSNLAQGLFKKNILFDKFKMKKISLKLNPQGIFSSKLSQKIQKITAASEGVAPTSELI